MYVLVFAVLRSQGLFPPRPMEHPDPSRILGAIFAAMLVGLAPLLAAYAGYAAAACHAAIEANRGRKVTFRGAYGMAWRDAVRYVWLMILQALCVASPAVLMFGAFIAAIEAPGIASKSTSPGLMFLLFPLMMLGYLLAMVYAVWMGLRLGLAFPACVTENIGAVEALRRSAALTHKAKGRIFVVLLVVYGISYGAFVVLELVVFALAAIAMLIAAGLHLSGVAVVSSFGVVAVLFGAFFFVWITLIWAAYAISLSVLYEDQLLRIERPGSSTAAAAGGTA
jgi:hypothetical protein